MAHPNLFFSTAQSYGFTAGNYWSTMIADICGALGRAGVPCDLVETADSRAFQAFLANAIRQPRDFIATFNFTVPFADIAVGGKKLFPQELFAARSVTIFLDHPAHLAATIARFEAAARHHGYRPAPAPAPVYGVMEPDHAVLLRDLGIDANRIFLFPQAGPQPPAAVTPLAERPIDLLFYGTIADLPPEDQFFRHHGFDDRAMRDALGDAMDAVLSGREDPYAAVKTRLGRQGTADDVVRLAEIAHLVDSRARAVRRRTLLAGLGELAIHFCGNVAEGFRRDNPNGVYLGAKPFSEVMDLVRRSKIVLNDTINLRQGMLMRPCYAAAQGCVLALESNAWFRSAFADGRDAILLEPGARHAERLRDALAEVNQAQRIADAGRVTQAGAHRWDHRIGPLVGMAVPTPKPSMPVGNAAR